MKDGAVPSNRLWLIQNFIGVPRPPATAIAKADDKKSAPTIRGAFCNDTALL
jgi:hypothetical protein